MNVPIAGIPAGTVVRLSTCPDEAAQPAFFQSGINRRFVAERGPLATLDVIPDVDLSLAKATQMFEQALRIAFLQRRSGGEQSLGDRHKERHHQRCGSVNDIGLDRAESAAISGDVLRDRE